ncbi:MULTISPECIES: hypothetical protein [Pseudomonas]|uniref:SpaN/EivJ family type III secretion system needle length determinant n=1 Tax=Pseudomonas TaxID=286 RepID=UPI00030A17D4|nr:MULTISPECIES: hypothetical protein [Pseudomonas]
MDELPQGALMLLAQLQPLREFPLQLSLAALRLGAGTESRLAKVSVDQPMHLPIKQPSVPSSPALVNARLALAERLPITAQVLGQASVASALATADQAAVDVSAEQKAPLSSARLPLAMPTQVPDQAAAAIALWASDQAVADRQVKQQTPQAFPAQPLPLLEKSSYLNQVTRVAVPAKATAGLNSAPEVSIAREARNYLQVPFSKGDAVGLITVSKAGAERPEQLLLNPSSALVFSCLSDNLAQAPDPRWRLTDQEGGDLRHGHDQERPDEEVEELSRQALRDRSGRGEHQT